MNYCIVNARPFKTIVTTTITAHTILTMMWTDTRTQETHVVLAMPGAWFVLCVSSLWTLFCLLACVATVLALARYRDSERSSARLRFLQSMTEDYSLSLHRRRMSAPPPEGDACAA